MGQATDWISVEKFMLLGNTYKEASQMFGVQEATIRKRASRYNWPLPHKIRAAVVAAKQRAVTNTEAVAVTAKNLAQRGEEHAEMVFNLANDELAKAAKKGLPVRNWKDAELADKAARRAAGLQNDDGGAHVSIIQLNEAIDSHEPDTGDVIEAEIVREPSADTSRPQITTGTEPVLDDGSGKGIEVDSNQNHSRDESNDDRVHNGITEPVG